MHAITYGTHLKSIKCDPPNCYRKSVIIDKKKAGTPLEVRRTRTRTWCLNSFINEARREMDRIVVDRAVAVVTHHAFL